MDCYKGKSLECECGDIHCLSDVVIDVGKDIFGNFVEYIAGLEGDKILVFYDLKDEFLLQKLRESDLLKNKDINYIIFPNILPTIELVNKIEDKGQQVVIAIGDENIISFAKYYASCFSNNFCIFPVGEFLDFTFSRFARIFDGVRFNFYDCVAPMAIFVDCSLNKLNDYQTYYLSSKFIAVFDNNLSSSIWEIEYCQRIVDFFKNTLEKYSSRLRQKDSDLNKNNIWTLIRMGLAMTFFNQTKCFFGGDRAVVEMLSSLRPSASFLELETVGLKLIMNTYSCFLDEANKSVGFNVNRHINNISNLLKISVSYVLKNLASSDLLSIKSEVLNVFGGYQHYFKGCFKNLAFEIFKIQSFVGINENIVQKYRLSYQDIEKAFASSPCIFNKHSLLHVIYGFGYLDKLL